MRVALVCPYSLSVHGGVQGQVTGLRRALVRAGHEVTVLAPGDGELREDGVISVGRSIGVRANGSVAPISPFPSTWRATTGAIAGGGFDVVHVHEPFVPGPSMAAVIGSRTPVIGTFHQSGWGWPYRLAYPLVRLLGRRLAAAVAVSESAAAMVRAPIGREIELLWNGVEPGSARNAQPVPKRGPTIAFVGRHEVRKGLEVLLRAMAHLDPQVRLWVMSDGPLTPQLKSAYGSDPRVEWLGRVDDTERDARLASADVYCAPNLGGESFGVVLAEAMAAGAPVVASNLDAFRAVARPDMGEAILTTPGDPLALAAGLRRVLNDATLGRKMSEAGRRRADQLSMERLAARYIDIYEKTRATRQ